MDKSKLGVVAAIAVSAAVVTTVGGGYATLKALGKTDVSGYPAFVQTLVKALNGDTQSTTSNGQMQGYPGMNGQMNGGMGMNNNMEETLTQAVEDGEITEAQKQLILDKLDEIQSEMQTSMSSDLTEEERKTKMDAIMEELNTWAEENDIPEEYVMMGGAGGTPPDGNPNGNGNMPSGTRPSGTPPTGTRTGTSTN